MMKQVERGVWVGTGPEFEEKPPDAFPPIAPEPIIAKLMDLSRSLDSLYNSHRKLEAELHKTVMWQNRHRVPPLSTRMWREICHMAEIAYHPIWLIYWKIRNRKEDFWEQAGYYDDGDDDYGPDE